MADNEAMLAKQLGVDEGDDDKMKLLYGTGNLAKLSAMKNRLEQLDIELIGLNV